MLANWFFFWTESDWTGVAPTPSPTPTDEGRSDAGGGHKKRRYERLGEDFWNVRERYLRRFVEPAIKQAAQEVPHQEPQASPQTNDGEGAVILLRQAMEAALNRARNAQTFDELQDAAQRSLALSIDIANIKNQYYNRAIAILLLDVL